MKIYAYSVEWNDSDNAHTDLNHVAQFLVGLSFEERYLDGIRIEDFREVNGLFFFDFSLLRSSILPGKAKRNTPTVSLGIDDDDSVSEETACLYHPPSRTLVVQYNLHGPKKKSVEQYLNGFVRQAAKERNAPNWRQSSFFDVVPYITNDTAAKFRRLQIFRNLELKVIMPPVGPEDRQAGSSLDDVLGWGVNGGAKNAVLRLSAGRERNASLSERFVRRLVRRFNRGDVEFEKLSVKGKQTPDSASEVLDFVEALLKTETDIAPGGDRRLPRTERYVALENALQSWLRAEIIVAQ